MAATAELREVLRSRFGHADFRPHQREVCEAATGGRDLLLVMPTGAGKSLCYQLPALVRGGSALVISPLIALMDDQVTKLQSLGFAVERLHSGRAPAEAATTAQRWLAGELDLLYVAPERLGVASFRRLVENRRPRLVAVDEAHCISHWGHDFRPDYRRVGPQLEGLREGPMLAVTATATPRVQSDILGQLGIPKARRFIRGFRRDNLAIEVVEAIPSARPAAVARVLSDGARRPAIVYAPTRRETESLAADLTAIAPTGAYHAGLDGARRDRVQREFNAGDLEIVVATVAFGMGVDKADIRTVVHTALPGTVEAYYQEIGRAGRDGRPSRAVLLWSWADRKTQEFFHDKSYPPPAELARIWRHLESGPLGRSALESSLRLDPDRSSTLLNQLWLHGGIVLDEGGLIHRATADWRSTYEEQRDFRLEQIEEACRFATGRGCRMASLVRHFGDHEDSGQACGQCDSCAPDSSVVVRRRRPTSPERVAMERMLAALEGVDNRTTGQLYSTAAEPLGIARRDFERLVDALSNAGILDLWQDSFVKNDREIRFHRARLSREAVVTSRVDLDEVLLASPLPAGGAAKPKKKARTGSKRTGRSAGAASSDPVPARPVALSSSDEALLERLRAWRLEQARKAKAPAYTIFPDRTLTAIARARPSDLEDLMEIHGIGPAKARKWGLDVLAVVDEAE